MEYCPRCEKYVETRQTEKDTELIKHVSYHCSVCNCFIREMPHVKDTKEFFDELG